MSHPERETIFHPMAPEGDPESMEYVRADLFAELQVSLAVSQREAADWKQELEAYKATENARISELQADLAQARAEAKTNGDEAAAVRRLYSDAMVGIGELQARTERLEKRATQLADENHTLKSWEVSSRATFQHIEELISGHDEFVCQDVQRAINQQVRPNGHDPNCEACHGDGEYLGHSPDCDDDLCALNGDMYSCVGEVVQCDCVPAKLSGEQS